MKRVLFYDDVPIFGGHQVTAIAAARHLAANGIEVVSAFRADNERMHRAWSALGDAVRLVPLALELTRWQPFLAPFGIAAKPVRQLLRDVAPDVLVAVQGTIVQSNRVVEQARRLGIPVISFIPMGVHFAPGLWFQAAVARVLERYHYRRPNAFLTTSEHAGRELVAGGARAPIRVVYCGVDVARLHRNARPANSRYTLAIVGRVSFGTKGHDVLLHAMTRLPDMELVIVGDGPDDARADALIAELGLGERVRRLAWQNDMSAIYSSVDMVVIPSRFEGLPQVALEAMHFGLPIVAADMGAMREIVPESWLFPAGDAAACAATILRVRNADNRDLLDANRERIERELNEDAYGLRFSEALQELYESTRRASR